MGRAGLPSGWGTEGSELMQNQQITALGNEVLPVQAVAAIAAFLDS